MLPLETLGARRRFGSTCPTLVRPAVERSVVGGRCGSALRFTGTTVSDLGLVVPLTTPFGFVDFDSPVVVDLSGFLALDTCIISGEEDELEDPVC